MSEMIYKKSPNQDNFTVHREKVEQPFLYIKWESVDIAKANLSPLAFCLWLYLARHRDGTRWIFSMPAFCTWAGCSRPTGIKAKKELLDPDVEYLVPTEGKKNCFDFYECPEKLKKNEKETDTITIHKISGNSPEEDGFSF